MDYILPWLWVQLCAISWIVITAPETVKTTEQVSRLTTDNVIADNMGNYKEMHVYMGQPNLRPLWSTSDSRATKLQTLTTRRPKPPVTRGMSHLKRNLILEQKSPLNSLAYSSINRSKTFSFTAEYSFIRHKWTLYYRNAPPPESGNLQVGLGIRKNTAS